MTIDREIYPNAPLQLVAFELRNPYFRSFKSDSSLASFEDALSDWLKVVEVESSQPVPDSPGDPKQELFRIRDNSRETMVTVRPVSVTIETSAYKRYEEFRLIVEAALKAAAQSGLPLVERIGLRYIDEVRITFNDGQGVDRWKPYIASELLASAELLSRSPRFIQGAINYDLGGHHEVTMRYGLAQGRAVRSSRLRVRDVGEGEFFLVDIDSYWTADEGEEEFDPGFALTWCDTLRDPVRELFEASITEQLREEVLRRPKGDSTLS